MSAKITLSDGEIRILGLAWQCFKSTPEVDYKKLCPLVGHTNPASTANAFRAIKKKLDAMATENGDGGATAEKSTPTPSTAAPNSKAKSGTGNDKGSPTKSAAGTKRKAADVAVKEENASNSDDEETPKPSTGKAGGKSTGPNAGIGKESSTATGRMNTKATAAEKAKRTPPATPTSRRGNKNNPANKKPKLGNEFSPDHDDDNAASEEDVNEDEQKKKSNGRASSNANGKTPAKGKAKGKGKAAAEHDNAFPLAVDDTKAQVAAEQSILKPGTSAKDVFPNLRDHSVLDYEGEPIDKHGKIVPEIETNGIDRFEGEGLKHNEKAEIDEHGNHRIYTIDKDGRKIYEDEASGSGGSEDGEVKVEDAGLIMDGDLEEDAYMA